MSKSDSVIIGKRQDCQVPKLPKLESVKIIKFPGNGTNNMEHLFKHMVYNEIATKV